MLTIIVIIISALIAITVIATLFMLYLLGKTRMADMRDFSDGSSFSTSTSPGGSVGVMVSEQTRKPPAVVGAPGKLTFLRDDGPMIDLHDLLRASAEVLGYGNFGSAYKAVLMDGHAVVVKRFRQTSSCGKEEFHEHMRKLGRLSHPNLLPVTAYYYRKEEKLLVYDFVQNGSLQRQLHGNYNLF